jgi:hypothetical protein
MPSEALPELSDEVPAISFAADPQQQDLLFGQCHAEVDQVQRSGRCSDSVHAQPSRDPRHLHQQHLDWPLPPGHAPTCSESRRFGWSTLALVGPSSLAAAQAALSAGRAMFFRLEGPLEQTRARPHTDIAASSQERTVRTQGSRHIQRKKGGMYRSECGRGVCWYQLVRGPLEW